MISAPPNGMNSSSSEAAGGTQNNGLSVVVVRFHNCWFDTTSIPEMKILSLQVSNYSSYFCPLSILLRWIKMLLASVLSGRGTSQRPESVGLEQEAQHRVSAGAGPVTYGTLRTRPTQILGICNKSCRSGLCVRTLLF